MGKVSFDMCEPPTNFREKRMFRNRPDSISESTTIECVDEESEEPQPRQYENSLRSISNSVTPTRASLSGQDFHKWSREFWSIGLATGSIHLVLSNMDIGWKMISLVEMTFFGLNFGIFVLNSVLFLCQLIGSPSRTWEAINDPHKGLSLPLMVTQMGTLILGCFAYIVPGGWMGLRGSLLIFYIYIYFSISITLFSWTIWFRKSHELKQITPSIILLSFPLLIVGVVTVNLLEIVPFKSEQAMEVLLIGYLFQGMSSMMAGAYLIIYLQRLAITGHMSGVHSSSVFIAVAPPGFTAHVLIKLGRLAPIIFVESPNLFLTEGLGETCQGFGMLAGLLLTGVSLLIYAKSVIAFWWKGNKIFGDLLGIWIMIFPNVGLVFALRSLLELFGTSWLLFMQLFLSGVLVTTYLALVPLTIFALVRKRCSASSRRRSDAATRTCSGFTTPVFDMSPSRTATDRKIEAHQMDLFSAPSLSRSDSVGGKTLVAYAI